MYASGCVLESSRHSINNIVVLHHLVFSIYLAKAYVVAGHSIQLVHL